MSQKSHRNIAFNVDMRYKSTGFYATCYWTRKYLFYFRLFLLYTAVSHLTSPSLMFHNSFQPWLHNRRSCETVRIKNIIIYVPIQCWKKLKVIEVNSCRCQGFCQNDVQDMWWRNSVFYSRVPISNQLGIWIKITVRRKGEDLAPVKRHEFFKMNSLAIFMI